MLEAFQNLVLNYPNFFVPVCKLCTLFFKDKFNTEDASFCAVFNRAIVNWTDFQYSARLRPGEAELLQIKDKHSSMHQLGDNMVECDFLFFRVPRKNDLGGPFRLDLAASEVFETLAADRPKDAFLVPRCADRHIGEAIRKASGVLEWHPDVVWVAHCLRHSIFTSLTEAVASAVNEFVTGVTQQTLTGTYTVPMSQRVAPVAPLDSTDDEKDTVQATKMPRLE